MDGPIPGLSNNGTACIALYELANDPTTFILF